MGINPKSHGVPNFFDYMPGRLKLTTGTSFPAAGRFGAYPKDRGPAGAPGAHSVLPKDYFGDIKSHGGLDLSDNTKAVKANTEIHTVGRDFANVVKVY